MSSVLVDNLIAYRIIKMLVTPFAATDAYKYGIIDAHGNVLRKSSTLTTAAEKESYTYLTRLVINMKKILAKFPAAENNLHSMVAALFLVKECYTNKIKTHSLMEARFTKILEHMSNGVVLVEEEILVTKFLNEDGGAGGGAAGGVGGGSAVPANVTGDRVSTNTPKLLNTKVKKYKELNRRSIPVELRK